MTDDVIESITQFSNYYAWDSTRDKPYLAQGYHFGDRLNITPNELQKLVWISSFIRLGVCATLPELLGNIQSFQQYLGTGIFFSKESKSVVCVTCLSSTSRTLVKTLQNNSANFVQSNQVCGKGAIPAKTERID